METNQLIIRRFKVEDLCDFKELIRDKMNSKMSVYDDQFPIDDFNLQNILNYFISTDDFLAVILKNNKKLIGFISLNRIDDKTRNLGYCFHTDYQGFGYATEAITLIIEYCKKELKLDKLISGTALNNIPSMKLLNHFKFNEVSRSTGCFTNDENGNPINFVSCLFELKL